MEIAIAAAKAGKMVLCEKPLARTAKEGEKMVAAVGKAGVPNTVWYNYRRVPPGSPLKHVADTRRPRKSYPYRAKILQDRAAPPRLALDPGRRQRSPRSRQMVGARPVDRVRALLHPPARRLPRRRRQRDAGVADLPRSAGDDVGLRRDHQVGQDWEVGGRGVVSP